MKHAWVYLYLLHCWLFEREFDLMSWGGTHNYAISLDFSETRPSLLRMRRYRSFTFLAVSLAWCSLWNEMQLVVSPSRMQLISHNVFMPHWFIFISGWAEMIPLIDLCLGSDSRIYKNKSESTSSSLIGLHLSLIETHFIAYGCMSMCAIYFLCGLEKSLYFLTNHILNTSIIASCLHHAPTHLLISALSAHFKCALP